LKAAVEFNGVWKKFQRGERHDSLRDLLPALARRVTGRALPVQADREFWALTDVSFEVYPGEAFGIIGSNGAGKSTTLKLLNRILKPTRGHCRVHGRMGALIEVAAGFHPDLTGRENVYLQGAIMGMRRTEIASQFEAIVDFAGVEKFIDTPVKRYSSGMNARLGFSIAAHLNPDVLIVDEVLAVGDVAFQQRCFNRMEDFVRGGAAVVLVSHNLTAVTQLCKRAALLESGRMVSTSSAREVVGTYCRRQSVAAKFVGDALTVEFESPDSVGDNWTVESGKPIRMRVRLTFHQSFRSGSIGIVVWDLARNLYVYGAESNSVGVANVSGLPGETATYEFEIDANLAQGVYALEVNVFDSERQEHVARLMPAGQFTVNEWMSYSGIANLFLKGRKVDSGQPAIAVGRADR
jgi:lipopolysaccharide transport system ATP-binding protein